MPLTDTTAILTIAGVSLRHGGKQLLDDISFDVRPHERLLLLGVSGAGKSLLIDAIAGNLKAEGQVTFAPTLTKRDRTFAYDTFATLGMLKGHEVLRLVESLYGHPRDPDLVGAFRLEELLDRPTRVYSKGERKRIGTYLALFTKPKLAVLDEPTDGMDPLLRDRFWQVVEALPGATLMTTHLWDEANAHHDRVALIHDGRLLAAPAPVSTLLDQLGFAGKIVVGMAVAAKEGERVIDGNERRHLYFRNKDQRADMLARAKRYADVTGYSVLPLDLRDAYLLLGGGGVEQGAAQ